MSEIKDIVEPLDKDMLIKLAMDGFHRILVHYGLWFAEVRHQVGSEKALEIERKVWEMSLNNQMSRLGKKFGFKVENGVPEAISNLSHDELKDLLIKLGVNWLANDGIWFQAVEGKYGMNDAKRCNDTCWSRYSPFEASRIKNLLDLPDNGGLKALKKALGFRLYAWINEQSTEEPDDNTLIFRMNSCRVQTARKRKGLDDYPCKSAGLVEYPTFASAIDKRIKTECIGCPPDEHPDDWYCAWKFTI